MPKNAQTIAQLHSSHSLKVMLKILQARLQQYMNRELPDVQAGVRKGRGTRDQIANIHWIIKKAKWLSQDALHIAEKRREAKGREKERYINLNAEFQSKQGEVRKLSCKEIEENNRMGKTRSLQENERYQGDISCKDGLSKGQKWYGPNRSRRY